jgi:hypothetical protein
MLPPEASTLAPSIDAGFFAILAIETALLVMVTAAMIFFGSVLPA